MDQSTVMLRLAKPEDAKELLRIYAPYVKETAITFEYEVPTEEEFRGRIEKTLQHYPYLVAEDETGILGYAYAGRFQPRVAYDWAAETSIYIRMDQKRRGLGRMLYQALEEALKRQGILNVYACIACTETEDAHLKNDSIFFHEHLGYRLVGTFYQCGYKFHHWYDMVWMERMIGEHREEQESLRLFPEIRGNFVVWLEKTFPQISKFNF